ncbi:hypothetical protein L2E82_28596 [Cichorium intybus]|uniref:Uncharacterized protein n=1 Tax=Cichorium intybus TaxID=13427 RepID=A0ACB9CWH6_CICIN|nr:hypothetical protein L2E82_28596 [Cichorium intybus]
MNNDIDVLQGPKTTNIVDTAVILIIKSWNEVLFTLPMDLIPMYHHHQGKNIHSTSILSTTPERHLFLQGGGDLGLVLSTECKPRLKWTPDLHERFIEAVNQLVQRHLQLRVEARGKYLQAVLEKAQESLERQNLGTVGLEAAKEQLYDMFDPSKVKKVDFSMFSMSVGGLKNSEWNRSRSYNEKRFMHGTDEEVISMDQNTRKKTDAVKPENVEVPQNFRLHYFGRKLDLSMPVINRD